MRRPGPSAYHRETTALHRWGSKMTKETLHSVRDLLPGIADQARVVDETRRVSDDVIEDLQNTGVLRMLQPKRYGGSEIDPVEFYEVVRAISGACGSTGWIVSVLGVHPWHLALFDQRAQEDVWGHNRLELVSSAYAPMGQLLPVEGGYELSGTWKFSSGCDHASWALLGALQFGAEGRPVDFMTVLVPRADYTVQDVWDVVGMRGTASNEITVTKAFVPEYRTIRNYETAQLRGPGQKINSGPLYRLPFATIFTSAIAAPIVGVVAGSHESYVNVMRERVRLSLGGGRFAEDHVAQVSVARAASEIDAATLQMDRNVRDMWDLARAGGGCAYVDATAGPPRSGASHRARARGDRPAVQDRGRQFADPRQPHRASMAGRPCRQRPRRQRARTCTGPIRPRRIWAARRGQSRLKPAWDRLSDHVLDGPIGERHRGPERYSGSRIEPAAE